MQRDDLPLFRWKPPVTVILFPLTKRVGKIRHTALKLSGKQGDDVRLYWKQVVSANRRYLERIGLSEVEIEGELRAFFDAVQGELHRMSYVRHRPGGDAA